MAGAVRTSLLQHLRRLIGSPASSGVPDDQLLRRFLDQRDQAAFELIVWRHGPMVLNVCGRVLHDDHAAEDAFQTTFLKLALKAPSITKGESVGSWLYKVAYRTALRVRERGDVRAGHEQPLGELPASLPGPAPDDEAAWRELRPVLDDEVRRLPEKYRSVFILCCLQGMTNEQAARELGCPRGTVLSRLARARERLRKRLERRGLAVALVFPLLASYCGRRLLSADLVASVLGKVASLVPQTVNAVVKGGGMKSPAAVVVVATAAVVLLVSGASAFFAMPGDPEPPVPGPKPACCSNTGPSCSSTTAPIAIPPPDR